jgi:tryptophan synthase alpha chain
MSPGELVGVESALRAKRDAGGKILAPFVTGGITPDWLDVVRAVADAGADAIEIGIPFSDPVMDGPTIQEASTRALANGATPLGIVGQLADLDIGIPLVAMTYYNLIFHNGHRRFARSLVEAGVAGAIVPDLPLEELHDWERAAADAGVETVLLSSPVTPDDRLARICARSHGFVYAVSLMGVTGERAAVSGSAAVLAKRIKALTDLPVIIGFGISTPAQAVEAAAAADGVIVASALMRIVMDGGGPTGAGEFTRSLRSALDAS